MATRFRAVLVVMMMFAGTVCAVAKDSLVIGVAQFPNSLSPVIGSQTVQDYTIALAQRPITTYDQTGKIVCLLCVEVPSLENGLVVREDHPGGQGLAVTIRLRPGLAWGDGVPLTARDLAFTWKIANDPASGFSNVHPWTRASRVDVLDDQSAVLHLDQTITSFALWDQILPQHLEGPVYDAGHAAGDYINHTLYNRDPLNPGLWNGPFIVAAYRSNDSVQFAPNPHWAGRAPGFKTVIVRLLENTAALQANLLSGDVDMTPSGIGLSIDQAIALQKQYPGRFRFNYRPALSYEHIDLQFANPILRDLRVRQALLYGIDVRGIVAKLFGEYGDPAITFINGIDPHFIKDLPTYAYNPERARSLLDDAGWHPGPDGVRRDDKGERLSFEFATTSGNRVRELTQQVMQSQWKAIGIEVAIKNQPSRSFFGQLLKKREFTGMVEFASTLEVNLSPITRLGSAFIPSEANNWGGQNYSGISDSELDALLTASQYELDPVKQQAQWTAMQRIYSEKLLGLPLYFRTDPDVLPPWLKDYVATGKEVQQTYWAEDWRP